MRSFVLGVSVWGPGLAGWEASRPVLAGSVEHVACAGPLPQASMLSATERRRASPATRLALHAATEACAMSGISPDRLRAVFGTSNGDGAVIHAILESLTTGDGQVSPTQFHNSVHNATAGYWTIGTGSRQSADCLGCHDATAGMALLKAAAEAEVEQAPVLLCLCDTPMPEPLHTKRRTEHGFAAALVLSPAGCDGAIAALDVAFVSDPLPDAPRAAATDAAASASLRALTLANPAARILPLLRALSGSGLSTVRIPVLGGRIEASVDPCSTATRSQR